MNINNLDLSQVFGKPIGTEYDLYLTNDEIGDGCEYSNFVTFCRSLSPDDVVNLHISCMGGRCSTASMITNAIESSQATFVGHLQGIIWSAATTVALACDEWVVYDLTEFGVHSVQSFAGYGAVSNIHQRASASMELDDRITDKFYKDFLTEYELDSIKNGAEITFFKEELLERLAIYQEARNQQDDAEYDNYIQDSLVNATDDELKESLKVLQSEIKKRKQQDKTK